MTTISKSEREGGSPLEKTVRYSIDHSWKDEIDEFAEAILYDKPITYGNSTDALQTMELVYRIYCADASWREQFDLTCNPTVCGEVGTQAVFPFRGRRLSR